jgi:hypothetical protein
VVSSRNSSSSSNSQLLRSARGTRSAVELAQHVSVPCTFVETSSSSLQGAGKVAGAFNATTGSVDLAAAYSSVLVGLVSSR